MTNATHTETPSVESSSTGPTEATPARGAERRARLRGLRRGVVGYLRANPLVVAVAALGVVARFIYWEVTERRFEDGLITVVHAANAVDGIGLTHHPYEPVTHGFTSAISVLTPLAGELIGEIWSYVDGFLMLRCVSLVAFVAAVVFADRISRRLGVATVPRAFVLLFLALDYNHVMYGMSGMETQIAVCVLLGAIDALMSRAAVRLGILCGLCVLTRPDFILFVGPALLAMVLWNRRDGIRAALLTGAVVAPWLIFTTIYYGSPVPNTIEAKALRYHVEYPGTLNPGDWISFITDSIASRADSSWHQLTPFLSNGFVTDTPLLPFFSPAIATIVIVLAGAGVVATRHNRAWWPVLAFLALFLAYRFLVLPAFYYEWYYPPVTAILMICAGVGLTRFATLAPRTSALTALGLAALFAWPLPAMIVLDSRIQHDIEAKVREPMAKWLNVNVPPRQPVVSESAGYVGYFGKVRLWDYPGLTSKESLAFMRRLGWQRNNIYKLVELARPPFVVFRSHELAEFRRYLPQAAAQYSEVARFSVPAEQSKLAWGGVALRNVDREFIVVRRT